MTKRHFPFFSPFPFLSPSLSDVCEWRIIFFFSPEGEKRKKQILHCAHSFMVEPPLPCPLLEYHLLPLHLVCARLRRPQTLALCLQYHRHLLTSSPLALDFFAIINVKRRLECSKFLRPGMKLCGLWFLIPSEIRDVPRSYEMCCFCSEPVQ